MPHVFVTLNFVTVYLKIKIKRLLELPVIQFELLKRKRNIESHEDIAKCLSLHFETLIGGPPKALIEFLKVAQLRKLSIDGREETTTGGETTEGKGTRLQLRVSPQRHCSPFIVDAFTIISRRISKENVTNVTD